MVHNYVEDLVEQFLRELLISKDYDNVCKCERCQDDMKAYALNHLKPFYVTSVKGQVFGKYSVADVQTRLDMVRVIAEAIQVVSQNKHNSGN